MQNKNELRRPEVDGAEQRAATRPANEREHKQQLLKALNKGILEIALSRPCVCAECLDCGLVNRVDAHNCRIVVGATDAQRKIWQLCK